MDKDGEYPEGTINFDVVSRLKEISEMDDEDDNNNEEKEHKE